jgi:hypothetical protein
MAPYNSLITSKAEKQRGIGFTILILIILLFVTNFYSFVGVNPSKLVLIIKPLFQIIFLYFFYLEFKNGFKKKKIFTKIVFFLIFIPFFGFISAKFIYNQSFSDSYRTQLDVFAFSFYFLWHRLKITIKPIIYAFTIFSLGYIFIQIYQNISGVLLFGPWLNENGEVSLRNNFARFYISTPLIIFFTQLFYLNLFLIRNKLVYLFLSILFLVSIYLMLTRQVLASVLICNALLIINNLKYNKAKSKYFWTVLIAAAIAIIVTTYSDTLFSYYIDTTKNDLTTDNVRIMSYNFFWDKIIQNPLTFLFGNGMPSPNGSEYSNYIINLWNNYQIGVTDIGFIGYWFFYGAIYIALFLYLPYLYFIKHGKTIPFYLKMFLLVNYLQSIMIFPFRSRSDFVVWSLFFYITDFYISYSRMEKTN